MYIILGTLNIILSFPGLLLFRHIFKKDSSPSISESFLYTIKLTNPMDLLQDNVFFATVKRCTKMSGWFERIELLQPIQKPRCLCKFPVYFNCSVRS